MPAEQKTLDHVGNQAFVGRQAIFDGKLKIYAYELLFRSGLDNVFSNIDGDKATSSVISDSFFSLGINSITGGKRASINFTRNVLLGNYAQLLPKEKLVVEILENVEPEPEIIEAVQSLKAEGYTLALDDYTGENLKNPFLEHVDILKVDFMLTPPQLRSFLVKRFKPRGIEMLAEKVETREEFQAAVDMGYTLFQGYFFCKPTIVTGSRIPESKIAKLKLLHEVNKADLDYAKVEDIVKLDVALSYKLLRYINSAWFGLRQEVSSIGQTLALLGSKKIRKWISLVAIATLGYDKPPELLITAVVRARFCELLAGQFNLKERADDLFLMGMFSTIDALLDMPMNKAIEEINMPDDLKRALLGKPSELSTLLNLVIGYEAGDWDLYETSKQGLHFDDSVVPAIHMEALKMAEDFMQSKE